LRGVDQEMKTRSSDVKEVQVESQTKSLNQEGAAKQSLEETLADKSFKLSDRNLHEDGTYSLTFQNDQGVKNVYDNVSPFKHAGLPEAMGLVTTVLTLDQILLVRAYKLFDKVRTFFIFLR
jgi:hypothetical protein